MKKMWLKSKTLWWNFLTVLVAVFAMPDVISLFPSEWLGYIGLINAFGNIMLRMVTTQPIGVSDD